LLLAPEFDFWGCAEVRASDLEDEGLEAFTEEPALPCLLEDWLTLLSDDCLTDGLAEVLDSEDFAGWLLLSVLLTCLLTP
jgi:hypothetical protein